MAPRRHTWPASGIAQGAEQPARAFDAFCCDDGSASGCSREQVSLCVRAVDGALDRSCAAHSPGTQQRRAKHNHNRTKPQRMPAQLIGRKCSETLNSNLKLCSLRTSRLQTPALRVAAAVLHCPECHGGVRAAQSPSWPESSWGLGISGQCDWTIPEVRIVHVIRPGGHQSEQPKTQNCAVMARYNRPCLAIPWDW